MENEDELKGKIYNLNIKIEDYNKKINEMESNKLKAFFHGKEIQKLKDELKSFHEEKERLTKLLEPFDPEKKKIRLEKKKELCQKIIDEIYYKTTFRDEDGKDVIIHQDIKMSFLEDLRRFENTQDLLYVFNFKEMERYVIREGFELCDDDTIVLFVETNDYHNIEKRREDFKNIDEMILKYKRVKEEINGL